MLGTIKWFIERLNYIQNNVIKLFDMQEKAESKNLRVAKTNKENLMPFSKYVMYENRQSRLIKNQEASRFN